jgi:enamine deaminase RidA (YjgF/YER057c/UK114 family)
MSPALRVVVTAPPGPAEGPAALGELFTRHLDRLRRDGLQPLLDRLYVSGPLAHAAPRLWASQAAAAGVEPGVVGQVVNPPCAGGTIAGIFTLAAGPDATVESVGDAVRARGPGWEALIAADITGDPELPAPQQLQGMFDNALDLLEAHGFALADVPRTWLHLPALLDWYDDLNRVRNALFERLGIGREAGPPPASTGIQGMHPDDRVAAFLDLVALRRDDGSAFRPVNQGPQCEAWDYGSAFSRGMVATLPDADPFVTISGTASIDGDGRTVFQDDPSAQIRKTWSVVGELLSGESLTPPQATGAVTYVKDEAVYAAWRGLQDTGDLPQLDEIVVYADVCRHDLLFETEVAA